MNYYGQNINMLFQILSTQTALIEQFNQLSLMVEAIAEKVDLIETKKKAMKAVNYMIEAN